MKAKYKVAELVFEMEPRYAPLLPQSKEYLYTGEEASLGDITITEEIYQSYEKRYPGAERPLIEYMATGALFYENLISRSGLLLHSSAVELDGKAYLFSAPSGTGKSTHTGLWLKEFGPRAQILNDDKPAIRILKDGFYVYGTPWSGKTDLNMNKKVPLQGITFLARGEHNEISPMPSADAIRSILEQTVRPKNQSKMVLLLDLIDQIIGRIPIYQMKCNMDPEAARVSFETMSKGEIK